MTNRGKSEEIHPLAPLPGPLPLDRSPAAVYLATLAEGSRRAMRQALDTIARLISNGKADALTLPWSELRSQHSAAVRAALSERYAPATTNKMLSSLRGALKAAYRLGQIDAESFQRAVDVANVEREAAPARRLLTAGDLEALRRACRQDPGPAGARDAALIALMVTAGPQRSEVVALDLADWDQQTCLLRVRGTGRRRERMIPFADSAVRDLRDWLALRGDRPGPLFCRVGKGAHGRVTAERLTSQAVYQMLQRRVRQAGVRSVTPQDLRRSFVSGLLEAGTDIATVQRLAGQASVATTSRYDPRAGPAKREPAEKLDLPDVSPARRTVGQEDWRSW